MNPTTVLFGLVATALVLAVAVAALALGKLKRSGTSMSAREFFTRMLRRAHYANISPATLHRRLATGHDRPLIIDLRDGARYAQGHVAGAVHHQFDDFLRAVVVEGAYDEHRRTGREVVLVCDTGHMSRVAGEILVEDEGFANVVNLRGGMHRWQRWQAERRHERTGCCGGVGMPACCPASSRSTSRT